MRTAILFGILFSLTGCISLQSVPSLNIEIVGSGQPVNEATVHLFKTPRSFEQNKPFLSRKISDSGIFVFKGKKMLFPYVPAVPRFFWAFTIEYQGKRYLGVKSTTFGGAWMKYNGLCELTSIEKEHFDKYDQFWGIGICEPK